ncbi:DUF5667 domain-containing protein [Clostridium magnum]|uniref:DUF5667 domain-containing protein n=1 Tax=Clostridium magnum DSM 2767 TaxID=1121326 RepID=A0A162SNP0_9CLOT|nr:DUF5667 domain-containing protein [Clostridium magnum]KZL91669.1 hypothetical protein CLMAG_34280 [Clostridium magnum DSM 2767]SHH51748.1 hypothetical protein SAMN02745944_00867 [Clostridium magnum DSM 2767]
MKKIVLFVAAIAVSLSIGGRAFADTNTATLADKAGITPDNTIIYPIDKALDDVKVSIASGEEKEAEALVDVAEERLGESEVLADKEETELSTQTLNEYTDKMAEAQDKLDAAIDEASSSTTDSAVKLEELEKLASAIASRQMKSIEVLKNIEGKVSENAKETIAQVIEMQTRKKEAIIAVAKERQAFLESKKAVKEAEKKLQEAKKAGDEEAIKAAETTLSEAQLTLNTQNEKLAQAVASKKEAMKGGVGQLKKEARKAKTTDEPTSTNNTTSEDATTTTETTATQNNESTSSNTNTNANTTDITDTANTTSTADTNQSTVKTDATATNSPKTDVKVEENKEQETKADKSNNSKETKETKANKDNKDNETKGNK